MNLFDVGGTAVVGDAEIADRTSTQCRYCGDSLQRRGSGNVRIADLKYPVGIARQSGRQADGAGKPYRTEPPGGNEVYVSHLGFLVIWGRNQKLVVRRIVQLRVGGRVRKSDVLKFAPGVELISGSNPVYFVHV